MRRTWCLGPATPRRRVQEKTLTFVKNKAYTPGSFGFGDAEHRTGLITNPEPHVIKRQDLSAHDTCTP